jgi:hypothetical protein
LPHIFFFYFFFIFFSALAFLCLGVGVLEIRVIGCSGVGGHDWAGFGVVALLCVTAAL